MRWGEVEVQLFPGDKLYEAVGAGNWSDVDRELYERGIDIGEREVVAAKVRCTPDDILGSYCRLWIKVRRIGR